MKYYLITETLKEVSKRELGALPGQFAAVLSPAEWAEERESFNMGIDIEPEIRRSVTTKAEVNYDSLTGSFCIPNRGDLSDRDSSDVFAFALDEKGIVFIDSGGASQRIIEAVQRSKKWSLPSLERFIYDFMEQIIRQDRALLEHYEDELDVIEGDLENESKKVDTERANAIRSEVRNLQVHYEQLMDFAQELEENENDFFKEDNLRYFRLFLNRVERLRASAIAVADHAHQINDIYRAQLDVRQNRIMTVLTVITSIFMPLTLITGWYGMNFRHMPELEYKWSYPVVFIVCVLIVVACLWVFRKKKWL